MQNNFVNTNRPNYLNYGSIGFVIGHEVSHGFDTKGITIDHKGNVVDWWKKETKEKYFENVQCIIDQYNNYTEPSTGIKLNGTLTQLDDISDHNGIVIAYRAYQKWVQRNGPEQRLPGLKFTPNQIFWISFAQSWCSAYSDGKIILVLPHKILIFFHQPGLVKKRILMDVHSLPRFRIIGPISNNPQFSNDFNCPKESKMNPLKKCKVW